jgi:outer membrane protein, heavy metal efflux system
MSLQPPVGSRFRLASVQASDAASSFHARKRSHPIMLLLMLLTPLPALTSPSAAELPSPLTLAEAERLALERSPGLQRSEAEIIADRARARYSGELPDPELRLGVQNVPVDTFSLEQEPMTMVAVGVAQRFPPPGKRGLVRRGAEEQTAAAQMRHEDLQARLRRDVDRAWIELFYRDRALAVTRDSRDLAETVLQTALSRYRVGEGDQSEVLRARLARDELLEREQSLEAEREAAGAKLAQLLNAPAREALVLPKELPPLPAVEPAAQMLKRLEQHPQVSAIEAEVRSLRLEADAARRDYLPEFGIEASYGYRRARSADGSRLPDMVSVGLVMSLPLFRDKRQDARLQEKRALAIAGLYQHHDMVLQLREAVQARQAELTQLRARASLVQKTLLPTAAQNVEASLAAFRTGKSDLDTVLRARQSELDYELKLWRLRADTYIAAADLGYLAAQTRESDYGR